MDILSIPILAIILTVVLAITASFSAYLDYKDTVFHKDKPKWYKLLSAVGILVVCSALSILVLYFGIIIVLFSTLLALNDKLRKKPLYMIAQYNYVNNKGEVRSSLRAFKRTDTETFALSTIVTRLKELHKVESVGVTSVQACTLEVYNQCASLDLAD